jgi:four helix bundle protein
MSKEKNLRAWRRKVAPSVVGPDGLVRCSAGYSLLDVGYSKTPMRNTFSDGVKLERSKSKSGSGSPSDHHGFRTRKAGCVPRGNCRCGLGICALGKAGWRPPPCPRPQWLRASQSIPLNVAEGNGKTAGADRRRYFETARGSAPECAAIQDVLVVGQGLDEKESQERKIELDRMAAMPGRLARRGHSVQEAPSNHEIDFDGDSDFDTDETNFPQGAALNADKPRE